MPELPDVTVYVERLRALTIGQPLEGLRIAHEAREHHATTRGRLGKKPRPR